jgi:hypothetical protein
MLERLIARLRTTVRTIHDRLRQWTRPSTRPVLGYAFDRLRSPDALLRENALLRKHYGRYMPQAGDFDLIEAALGARRRAKSQTYRRRGAGPQRSVARFDSEDRNFGESHPPESNRRPADYELRSGRN